MTKGQTDGRTGAGGARRSAVITIVSGRHDHLRNQQRGLALPGAGPDLAVVVSMGDQAALELTSAGPLAAELINLEVTGGLPLAAARNRGAEAALAGGAEVLIFLDVDCVPSPGLVARYVEAVTEDPPGLGAVYSGVVRYLGSEVDLSGADLSDVAALTSLAPPHPARPAPLAGSTVVSTEWQLFWSLSFAVSAATWRHLGGFDEAYVGYGGEDTDLGWRMSQAGCPFVWLGGADAFHQYHPTESPPVRHLDDIVRNATIFHDRWGFWPMTGWLEAFAARGLAEYDETVDRWTVSVPPGA